MFISSKSFSDETCAQAQLVKRAITSWHQYGQAGGHSDDHTGAKLLRRTLYSLAPNLILAGDIPYISAIAATLAPCEDMAMHVLWSIKDDEAELLRKLPDQTEHLLAEAYQLLPGSSDNPFETRNRAEAEEKQQMTNSLRQHEKLTA